MRQTKLARSAENKKTQAESVLRWCKEMASDWGESYVPLFREQLKKVLQRKDLPDALVVSAGDWYKALLGVMRKLSTPKALAARNRAWDRSMKTPCGPCENFKKFNF